MAFQELMLAMVAVADALMLGNVHQDMMSAVSLATQVQFVQNMILFTVTSALAVLGSQYLGKGDKKSYNDLFCLTLRLAGAVSLVFFGLCFFIPGPLMRLFTNQPQLIALGEKYLKIASFSYLLTGLSQVNLKTMKLSGHATMAAAISGSAVLINIIGNALFILGLFGISPMGVEGAALSTLIARIIEFAWSFALSAMGRTYIRPKLKGLFSRNKLLTKDFYVILWPLLLAGLMWGISFTSYSAFMGHLGSDAAAANSVVAMIRDLVCCVCNGLAGAAGVIVGNELGQGKLTRGKSYGIKLAKISYICGFASTAVMLAATPALIYSVKLSQEARKLFIGMMIIMAVYMIGRCVNTVIINGIFSAGGDIYYDMYSLAVMTWCIAVPLAALGTFLFHWHPLVVYACTCIDEVGKIPWVMIHFKKYKWVKDLTRDTGEPMLATEY